MADIFADAESLKRRRALLDAMTQQNMQSQIQGGGNYGLGQALAKIGTAWTLKNKAGKLEEESSANREAYNKGLGGEVDKYLTTRQGGQVNLPGPTEDGSPLTGQMPGDPRAAIVAAMTSRFPEMQGLGKMELANLGKQEQETFGNPVTERGPDGKLVSVQYGNKGTRRPVQGAVPFEKPMVVNEQLVDPATPPGTDFRTTYNQPESINGDLYQREARPGGPLKKLDNAPKVSVGVGGPVIHAGQKKISEAWATKATEDVQAMAESARGSVKLLSQLNQLEQSGRAGVLSGPTATPAMFLSGLAKSLGVPINEAQLANSQTFDAAATAAWQDMIKQAGGNRGVVKEEAQRIMVMVPQLVQSPQGRAQITAYLRQAAQENIKDAQTAQKQLGEALYTDDPRKFTFGLSEAQIPRTAPLPAAPGAATPASGGVISLEDWLKR